MSFFDLDTGKMKHGDPGWVKKQRGEILDLDSGKFRGGGSTKKQNLPKGEYLDLDTGEWRNRGIKERKKVEYLDLDSGQMRSTSPENLNKVQQHNARQSHSTKRSREVNHEFANAIARNLTKKRDDSHDYRYETEQKRKSKTNKKSKQYITKTRKSRK